MTRIEVPRHIHPRDSAERLPQQHIGPEHALAAPGSDQLLPKRRTDHLAIGDRVVEVGGFWRALEVSNRRVGIPVRLTNEPDESVSQRLGQLGEVDGLQPVTGLLEWRVLGWQEGPQDRDVVLRPELIVQGPVFDRHVPTLL
jgi:hypothetical protein